jgi:hypothetical protein
VRSRTLEAAPPGETDLSFEHHSNPLRSAAFPRAQNDVFIPTSNPVPTPGRAEEAAAERAVTLRLWPSGRVATFDERRKSKEPGYVSQRVRLNDGLRRAGFPE